MIYRKLPHGNEMLSTIGLGLGNIHVDNTLESAEEIFRYALEHGINLYDMCCGNLDMYRAFGKAFKGKRDQVYTQMHFGAVYENDVYGYSRDLDLIKRSFDKVLTAADTDYTDFGYVHCSDDEEDYQDVMQNGIFDYMCSLKEQGVIRHLGFSSHKPEIAMKYLETGMIDLFMFSINPAYDYTKGEYAMGRMDERAALYAEAERRGVGITVMKPFAGGQLLDPRRSPIGISLTKTQCMQYCLDRPAVLTVLPGVGSLDQVKEVLSFCSSSEEDRDYSVLSSAAPSEALGKCVYCNHCAPCPAGIDIGLVNKYYDLARIGDDYARGHYEKLNVKADACLQCGHCDSRCPFSVQQMARMQEIREYFG